MDGDTASILNSEQYAASDTCSDGGGYSYSNGGDDSLAGKRQLPLCRQPGPGGPWRGWPRLSAGRHRRRLSVRRRQRRRQYDQADSVIILRSLLVPPKATMAHPDLCDVGGSIGCTQTDSVIVLRSLLVPPKAIVMQQCAPANPVSWWIEIHRNECRLYCELAGSNRGVQPHPDRFGRSSHHRYHS